jgi:hypothetical protein
MFRYLLTSYPEAINITNDFEMYPYEYAVVNDLGSYITRMLLRGNHALDSVLLYDLNYEERRFALFLAFIAVSKNYELTIWARLRHHNLDLLRIVISFL